VLSEGVPPEAEGEVRMRDAAWERVEYFGDLNAQRFRGQQLFFAAVQEVDRTVSARVPRNIKPDNQILIQETVNMLLFFTAVKL